MEWCYQESTKVPSSAVLAVISKHFLKMQEADSPLDKLENLLAAISIMFNSVSSYFSFYIFRLSIYPFFRTKSDMSPIKKPSHLFVVAPSLTSLFILSLSKQVSSISCNWYLLEIKLYFKFKSCVFVYVNNPTFWALCKPPYSKL